MSRARTTKLELAYLQLWLLTHLQRNMFADDRFFLPPPTRTRDSDADIFPDHLQALSQSLHAVNMTLDSELRYSACSLARNVCQK